jgi:hypothetical protein
MFFSDRPLPSGFSLRETGGEAFAGFQKFTIVLYAVRVSVVATRESASRNSRKPAKPRPLQPVATRESAGAGLIEIQIGRCGHCLSGRKVGQPMPRWFTQDTPSMSAISLERRPSSHRNAVRHPRGTASAMAWDTHQHFGQTRCIVLTPQRLSIAAQRKCNPPEAVRTRSLGSNDSESRIVKP